jgi:hypothetical protein
MSKVTVSRSISESLVRRAIERREKAMQEWVIKAIYAAIARPFTRRIAGGSPRSVLVGAALGGLLGSATGMGVMAAIHRDWWWYLLVPGGVVGAMAGALLGASFGRVSKEKKALDIELVEDLGGNRRPWVRGPLFRAAVGAAAGATVLGMVVALSILQGGTVTWTTLLGVLVGGFVFSLVGAGAGLLANGDEGDPGPPCDPGPPGYEVG